MTELALSAATAAPVGLPSLAPASTPVATGTIAAAGAATAGTTPTEAGLDLFTTLMRRAAKAEGKLGQPATSTDILPTLSGEPGEEGAPDDAAAATDAEARTSGGDAPADLAALLAMVLPAPGPAPAAKPRTPGEPIAVTGSGRPSIAVAVTGKPAGEVALPPPTAGGAPIAAPPASPSAAAPTADAPRTPAADAAAPTTTSADLPRPRLASLPAAFQALLARATPVAADGARVTTATAGAASPIQPQPPTADAGATAARTAPPATPQPDRPTVATAAPATPDTTTPLQAGAAPDKPREAVAADIAPPAAPGTAQPASAAAPAPGATPPADAVIASQSHAKTDERRTAEPSDAGDTVRIAPAGLAAPTAAATPPTAPAGPVDAAPASATAEARHLDLARGDQWLDTLARDIARSATQDGALHFKLNPAHLGALQVELANQPDGTAVRMTAQTEAARSILTDAQPRLVAEARAQGLRIVQTHVDLGTQTGGPSQGNGQNQRPPLPDRQPLPARMTAPSAQAEASAGIAPSSEERYA